MSRFFVILCQINAIVLMHDYKITVVFALNRIKPV